MNKYCLVIPVINEGQRIRKELRNLKKFSKTVDIVIVDGGSTDDSVNAGFLKKTGVKKKITTPLGQSIQYQAGFSWALKKGYKGIITVDGNNKDDVSAIPRFIKALDSDYDHVQGSRFIKGGKHKNTPRERVFFNRFVISPLLSLAAGFWYTDVPNAFRAYSRKYLTHPGVKPFRKIFKRYDLLFYLAVRANPLKLNTKEIPVTRVYPKTHVPTKILGWKKILDMWDIFKISLGLFNP
ncbi:MAG: family 2 glycosyl transferase [Candidatus Woesebacteria bacterium GW2011_GWB1_45_5]|uniref:Family 2 glycosyl transferase n=1 Tax=Candidatus Woesebacteria bacterium GW2011_GWB1_45_5 TaxID=1618581 RepID=A0A0G1MS10_9BACT|nr:MAG: family 2 glycosyl transferase [Candidatus Woesebacteria bacterium GW2011_GWB1_45_5]